MQSSEILIDKWVRNLKTAYTHPVVEPILPVNSFGVELAPPIKDINFKIMKEEGKEAMLKDKPMPIERMTAVTILSDRPYLHLMLSVTNPEIRIFTLAFLRRTTKYVD